MKGKRSLKDTEKTPVCASDIMMHIRSDLVDVFSKENGCEGSSLGAAPPKVGKR